LPAQPDPCRILPQALYISQKKGEDLEILTQP
jgi:hypothetical protein